MLVEQSVSAWTAPTARSEPHRSPIGSCGFTEVFGEILMPLLWDKGLAECGPNCVLCRPFVYQVSRFTGPIGIHASKSPSHTMKMCRYSSSVKNQGSTIIGSKKKSCLRTFRQGVFDNLLDLSDGFLGGAYLHIGNPRNLDARPTTASPSGYGVGCPAYARRAATARFQRSSSISPSGRSG